MLSPYSLVLRVARRFETNLVGDSALLFGALMIANVVGYGYQMLMARMLTPADYGSLVTLTSISYVLAVLMRTFQAWVIEAVASGRNRGTNNVRIIFLVTMRTLVPLGIVAFVLHWLVSGVGADFLNIDSPVPLILLGLYTFSSFLLPVPRGILMGLKQIRFASFVLVLEPLVRLTTAIALVIWGFSVNGAITSFALGNFAAFAVALLPLLPMLARHSTSTPTDSTAPASQPYKGLRVLDSYAIMILAVNSCLMFIGSIDQIAVKHYFSDQEAGNYAVAFLLGRVIAMTTMALSWVVFTRSTTMVPDDPRRAGLLWRALIIIGAFSMVLTAGYVFMPGLAVHLMGGSDYAGASAYVGLVGIEMTLFALVYTQAYFQISLKKTQITWGLIVAAVLEVILISQFHATVREILVNLISVMGLLLIYVSALSRWLLIARKREISPVARAVSMPAMEADLGEAGGGKAGLVQ